MGQRSPLPFSKYSGAGNDFLVIDQRRSTLRLDGSLVSRLCHRKLGIGADGVIALHESSSADYRMRIYNADGSEATMCGNGLRCLVLHLGRKNLIGKHCTIETESGCHACSWKGEQVEVQLPYPSEVKELPIKDSLTAYLLDTGVPHLVIAVRSLEPYEPFESFAAPLRRHQALGPSGANINIMTLMHDRLTLRTYERGVEAETLACGTGACAAATIAHAKLGAPTSLTVSVRSGDELYIEVQAPLLYMRGPATHLFDGKFAT